MDPLVWCPFNICSNGLLLVYQRCRIARATHVSVRFTLAGDGSGRHHNGARVAWPGQLHKVMPIISITLCNCCTAASSIPLWFLSLCFLACLVHLMVVFHSAEITVLQLVAEESCLLGGRVEAPTLQHTQDHSMALGAMEGHPALVPSKPRSKRT